MKNMDLLLVLVDKNNTRTSVFKNFYCSSDNGSTNPIFPIKSRANNKSLNSFIISIFKEISPKNLQVIKIYFSAKRYRSKIKKIRLSFSNFLSVKSHNSK